MNHRYFLQLAATLSRRSPADKHFFLGAVARRADGVLVCSVNGMQPHPSPRHHAEARLARKLTPDCDVYVARTLANGDWAISRPCPSCERVLRAAGVRKIFYTIANREYGVLEC